MIKKYFTTIALLIFGCSTTVAQINFEVNWTSYVTYYLSMVDINTGESNMPIFMAELKKEVEGPDSVPVNIEFEIIIDSDALSVKNQTLVKVETKEPLNLIAPIHLSLIWAIKIGMTKLFLRQMEIL